MADKSKAASPAKAAEAVYGAEEIIAAAERFGTKGYVVKAAFALAGKTEATEAEARRIVAEYRARKITD